MIQKEPGPLSPPPGGRFKIPGVGFGGGGGGETGRGQPTGGGRGGDFWGHPGGAPPNFKRAPGPSRQAQEKKKNTKKTKKTNKTLKNRETGGKKRGKKKKKPGGWGLRGPVSVTQRARPWEGPAAGGGPVWGGRQEQQKKGGARGAEAKKRKAFFTAGGPLKIWAKRFGEGYAKRMGCKIFFWQDIEGEKGKIKKFINKNFLSFKKQKKVKKIFVKVGGGDIRK